MRHTTQEREIIGKVCACSLMEVLIDCASQEQNKDHRCRNPEWSIQIRISFQNIQEVCSGI